MTQADVIIVGAGFGGLYAGHKLRQLGFSVHGIEAGEDVGGTWYWNRYPGARCDVESTEYSYSFDDDLQQSWDWKERFAGQPEILAYINHVADRFDLRSVYQFNTRVVAAEFDEIDNLWAVTTDKGTKLTAQFLLLSTGALSVPLWPQLDGIDSFKGEIYHTGNWPHHDVDFKNKHVGVIGTGSSGIQCIPIISREAAETVVFQRTPQFSIPAGNKPITAEYLAEAKRNYARSREKARYTTNGNSLYDIPDKSVLKATPEEREAHFDSLWARGGLNFLRGYNDLLHSPEANEHAAEYVRNRIREKVTDPQTAERLLPRNHYIGSKRPCSDTGYYEAYNRENVTLISVKDTPLLRATHDGIETSAGLHKLDAIVFATGFDALTGSFLRIDPVGAGGLRLSEKWKNGPVTYLGLMANGFPNMFTLVGPGSPSVLTNMVMANEQHVEWISDLLVHMRRKGHDRIESTETAESEWVRHADELARNTLYPTAKSWYMGANVPGKPQVFFPYVGGLGAYRQKCDEVAAAGYRGISLSGGGETETTRTAAITRDVPSALN